MEDKVIGHLQKADAFLAQAAIANLNPNLDLALAHSFYYAAYHAISALLARKGLEYKNHRQALTAFRRHFIQTKILTSEHNRVLTDARIARDEMDYDLHDIPDSKTLHRVYHRVVWFVAEIKRILPSVPPTFPSPGIQQQRLDT